MDNLLYFVARTIIRLLQLLPLTAVARIGRFFGGLAWWTDTRHRRVALRNLKLCFGHEKSAAWIRATARENFRRIGESFACAIKTASMSHEQLRPFMEF